MFKQKRQNSLKFLNMTKQICLDKSSRIHVLFIQFTSMYSVGHYASSPGSTKNLA